MSIIFHAVAAYARFFGGETGPAGLAEAKYIAKHVPEGGVVVDVGGGEGKLANRLADQARMVVVLDREMTDLPGSDNSIYEGSLRRLLRNRRTPRVLPLQGDATCFPLADASVDAVVSCQLLEHISSEGKRRFFEECSRVVKPGGVIAISTPCAGYIAGRDFWVSRKARQMFSKDAIAKMPRSLRGPWLEQSIEEWEAKVGHHGHGCDENELSRFAALYGLEEVNRRASHTGITAFWLEVMFTFPLIAMAASPLIRLLYELESLLPARPGINLLMSFRKDPSVAGHIHQEVLCHHG
jgi:ubiquinone/menaquinone biosynthesis C-methylase UbiE